MSYTESEEDYYDLTEAVRLVKEVIATVDNKVNEHEKKRRLKEFHSRMDSKSIMMMKSGQIFAREDLLRRKLIHDGALQLKNSQGRLKGEEMLTEVFTDKFFLCKLWKYINVFSLIQPQLLLLGSTEVHALLLSDVFVFLQEKDQKYVFAMLVGSCCSIISSLSPSPLSLLPCAVPSMFSPSLQSLQ